MGNLKWTITENNGGGIALTVWDDGYGHEYVHSGYEYVPESLMQDIKALYDYAAGNNDVTNWEGNDLLNEEQARAVRTKWENGDQVLDNAEMYDASGNFIPLTADDLYDDDDTTHIIADGDEEYITMYPDVMGNAGKGCLL
jgi:hypothetical protein